MGYTGVTLWQRQSARIKSLITYFCSRRLKARFLSVYSLFYDSYLLANEISPKGPYDSAQLSCRIVFISIAVSSSKNAYSIAIFLKIISFYVKVPVLSESKNYTLPNSSGMVEFLAMQFGISSSF